MPGFVRLPEGFSHPTLLGGGGFSSVYRVRQVALDRWIALKIVPGAAGGALLREARLHAGIQAGCIPHLYDAFQRGSTVYILMEWIRGVSLAEFLEPDRRRDELTDAHRRAVGRAMLQAVAQLHGLGFAHLDLKPANIFIAPGRGVILLDFGLSSNLSIPAAAYKPFSTQGTPGYMAPELHLGLDAIDPLRSDVYSMGKILLQVLAEHDRGSVCEAMLQSNPSNRPANGMEALTVWQRQFPLTDGETDWHGTAEKLCREKLSRRLYGAARECIANRRHEEAYALLAECIEEDPDYPEALDLIGKLPAFASRKRFIRRWAAIAGALAACVAIAAVSFWAGQRRGPDLYRQVSPAQRFDGSGQHVGFATRIAPVRPLPFSQPQGPDALAATLQVCGFPQGGSLTMDRAVQSDTMSLQKGIRLSWGTHLLVWRGADGEVQFKEHVRLLPFQTRRLSLQQ